MEVWGRYVGRRGWRGEEVPVGVGWGGAGFEEDDRYWRGRVGHGVGQEVSEARRWFPRTLRKVRVVSG